MDESRFGGERVRTHSLTPKSGTYHGRTKERADMFQDLFEYWVVKLIFEIYKCMTHFTNIQDMRPLWKTCISDKIHMLT
jgi:hypothetical protein